MSEETNIRDHSKETNSRERSTAANSASTKLLEECTELKMLYFSKEAVFFPSAIVLYKM